MKKVFMIHGYQGKPNGGWRPWLMGELAKKNIWACALPMPSPDKPEKDEWIQTIKNAIKIPTEEIFLIGHSLGVPVILHYLEKLEKGSKIGGVVFVSGPVFEIKRDGYKQVNKFLNKPFDFNRIKNSCKNFIIIHGDNDPNVPFSDAEYLAKNLSSSLISIPNGEHLCSLHGWYKLPEALKALEKMIK